MQHRLRAVCVGLAGRLAVVAVFSFVFFSATCSKVIEEEKKRLALEAEKDDIEEKKQREEDNRRADAMEKKRSKQDAKERKDEDDEEARKKMMDETGLYMWPPVEYAARTSERFVAGKRAGTHIACDVCIERMIATFPKDADKDQIKRHIDSGYLKEDMGDVKKFCVMDDLTMIMKEKKLQVKPLPDGTAELRPTERGQMPYYEDMTSDSDGGAETLFHWPSFAIQHACIQQFRKDDLVILKGFEKHFLKHPEKDDDIRKAIKDSAHFGCHKSRFCRESVETLKKHKEEGEKALANMPEQKEEEKEEEIDVREGKLRKRDLEKDTVIGMRPGGYGIATVGELEEEEKLKEKAQEVNPGGTGVTRLQRPAGYVPKKRSGGEEEKKAEEPPRPKRDPTKKRVGKKALDPNDPTMRWGPTKEDYKRMKEQAEL
eukprot:gnl/TRDRNA2_/TRDRNA2_35370_c0_seq1.p1 gnl/TRDRNA2_/TRDRNA2_35370_c0~~gnl/TRDRNA2_/TRDRNA2_35370_c0_seq1.p1  ORF type:complete len:430 (-),score=128.53 gnl/TRDRNA2_/TRDRNA2_35370_c0_seq1:65-1354(-)